MAGSAIDESEATMRVKKWSMSISACGRGAKGVKSVGVAIGARTHIGMRKSVLFEPPENCSAERLSIRWMGAFITGGFHLGSTYLHSKTRLGAEKNVNLLHTVAAHLALLKGPWVLAGDYNCTPAEHEATGCLKLVNANVIFPKAKG